MSARTTVALPAARPSWRGSPQPWIWLSWGAASLAMVGNVVALLQVERAYGTSYPSLTQQGIAQDLINLFLVGPAVIALGAGAARGSVRALLGWLGAVMFTVYNYVIYSFSVHFGPLFLVWVAVLGLSTYALLGGLAAVDADAIATRIHRSRFAGWFLVVIAASFATLWLSDIARSLASGGQPAAVTDIGVPTNAVHVLDLAIFLPAAVMAGTLLLRHRAVGSVLAPVLLLFLALTGLPIMLTPFVAQLRGDPADWGVMAPIAIVTTASLALFFRTTRITEEAS